MIGSKDKTRYCTITIYGEFAEVLAGTDIARGIAELQAETDAAQHVRD